MGPQLRAPCPAICPIQSSSGTQACSGSRDGIAAQVREVGGNKMDIPFLLLFFTLQFCASCQWATAWFNYDIHICISLVWGIHLPQRLFQKAEESIICWKSCPLGLSFRDADVLYLWKEGREEIIFVNYLLQVSFSVYILIWRFLCNLEGWKKGKI